METTIVYWGYIGVVPVRTVGLGFRVSEDSNSIHATIMQPYVRERAVERGTRKTSSLREGFRVCDLTAALLCSEELNKKATNN